MRLMMQRPRLIFSLLRNAERQHGEQLVVSRRVEDSYRDLAARSRRMAKALGTLNVEPGVRLGTLVWNATAI